MSNSNSENKSNAPAILLIGMAGSGKTTLMQRISSYISSIKKSPYVMNLDPAVSYLPYGANIDIRDTIDYKNVMKVYNLGPNGAILTALNLFTTKFNQVLDILDTKEKSDYILVDTPGQIELMTWSASGHIITESLASSRPTVIVYIIDTPRSISPITFMSNMLYACSILYKLKLPFILLFNKTDVVSHEPCLEWMQDFETFQQALEQDTSYMATLCNSMCMVLEEFYQHLRCVGVSAVTGDGMEELFKSIDEAVEEYNLEYKPQLLLKIQNKLESEQNRKKSNLEKLVKDMQVIDIGNDTENSTENEPSVFNGNGNALEDASFSRFLNK